MTGKTATHKAQNSTISKLAKTGVTEFSSRTTRTGISDSNKSARTGFSRSLVLSLGVLAALAAVVVTMSLTVVWLYDDLDYAYFIKHSIWDSGGPINTFSLFWKSQGNHYWFVNGRAVAHTIVQFFCGIAGQTAFAIANGAVYVVFALLVARLAGVRHSLRHPAVLTSVALLTILTFVTKMMPTTQVGFVWMFTLVACWLLLFNGKAQRWAAKGRTFRALRLVALFVFSLLAADGQEALSIGLAAATGLWWLHKRCRVGTVRQVMLWGFWLGTLTLCLSPGTLSRVGNTGTTFASTVLYMALSFRAFYVLLVVLVWKIARRQLRFAQFYHDNSLYVNAIVVLMAFSLLVGVYTNRQLFGIEFLSIVVVLRILKGHTLGRLCNTVFAVCAVAFLALQMHLILSVRSQYNALVRLYDSAQGNVVYFDRHRATANAFLREYRFYEDMVAFNDADTRHALQKYLRAERQRRVWPFFHPTYLRDHAVENDTVIEYAPQHFVVILTHDDTRVIGHYRSALTGRPLPDEPLTFSHIMAQGDNYKAYLAVPQKPFVDLVSVTLVP